jgi:penicillin V acylase-like amidase (Ntn superfamily)
MSMTVSRRALLGGAAAAGLIGAVPRSASACSRVFWNDNPVKVVGRTLDWDAPFEEVLWAMPPGLTRTGAVADNPATWTSKYASVVMGAYDKGAAEGVNDQGLAAHLLYLGDSQFEARDPKRPGVAFWLWTQYVLDNFKTVREAIAGLDQAQIIEAPFGPYEDGVPVHLALSDIDKGSAIIEFVDGHAVVHMGERYQVMTNEPTYDQQIANLLRYKEWGGTITELPGGIQPDERFVRAAYSLKYLPKTDDPAKSIAYIMGIMNNVSVPFGSPYIGVSGTYPTWWRSVIDLTNRVYAVETTVTPNVFWVDIDKLNNMAGAKPRRLPIYEPTLVGDVSGRFTEAPQPF